MWTPTPKQGLGLLLLRDPRFRRYLFDGGSRSGKTACIATYLITEATRYPQARILCARKHYKHAKATLWPTVLAQIQRLGHKSFWSEGKADLEMSCKNGSVIKVDGLDDNERVDRILGDEFSHIFLNEATQTNYETVTTIMTRLAQTVIDSKGNEGIRKLILDCNPKHKRHWLHRVGVQRVFPDHYSEGGQPLPDAEVWARLNWSAFDNQQNLPADFFLTLDALPKVQKARMRDGTWCDNEGAVYAEFDEDVHASIRTLDDMPSGWQKWPKYRAIDFGYTAPFCCIWGCTDPDGRLYIYRERYVRQVTIPNHARAIIDASAGEEISWTVADSEDANARKELSDCGIPNLAAQKDIEIGIQKVRERLVIQGDGMPRLYVVRDECPNTLNEFYAYEMDAPREGRRDKELPHDDDNHAMDPLRYMVRRLASSGGFSIG